jgi:hypothetical protein
VLLFSGGCYSGKDFFKDNNVRDKELLMENNKDPVGVIVFLK